MQPIDPVALFLTGAGSLGLVLWLLTVAEKRRSSRRLRESLRNSPQAKAAVEAIGRAFRVPPHALAYATFNEYGMPANPKPFLKAAMQRRGRAGRAADGCACELCDGRKASPFARLDAIEREARERKAREAASVSRLLEDVMAKLAPRKGWVSIFEPIPPVEPSAYSGAMTITADGSKPEAVHIVIPRCKITRHVDGSITAVSRPAFVPPPESGEPMSPTPKFRIERDSMDNHVGDLRKAVARCAEGQPSNGSDFVVTTVCPILGNVYTTYVTPQRGVRGEKARGVEIPHGPTTLTVRVGGGEYRFKPVQLHHVGYRGVEFVASQADVDILKAGGDATPPATPEPAKPAATVERLVAAADETRAAVDAARAALEAASKADQEAREALYEHVAGQKYSRSGCYAEKLFVRSDGKLQMISVSDYGRRNIGPDYEFKDVQYVA